MTYQEYLQLENILREQLPCAKVNMIMRDIRLSFEIHVPASRPGYKIDAYTRQKE